MLVTSLNWHLMCLVISIIDSDDYHFCLAKCENKYQYTKFRTSMYKGCQTNKRLNVKLILKSIYIYIYILSVLDFEAEINMYNKCQHEVAIFTA